MPRLAPELGAAVAAVGDELEVLATADRKSLDAERGELDRVDAALVVVGEMAGRPDRVAATGHVDHARVRGAAHGKLRELRPIAAGDELQGLEDGLGVLVLVLDDHLVDEAAAEQRVVAVEIGLGEQLEGAAVDAVAIGGDLVPAQQGQGAAVAAGVSAAS